MPNIKNKTLELCEHLDTLKISLKELNISKLDIFFKFIVSKYKSIKNLNINHISKSIIESENDICLVIKILKYMIQKDLVDTLDLNKEDCEYFKKKIAEDNYSDIAKFINQHSRTIYRVLGNLIWSRKLPQHILDSLDKYDNLIYGHFTPLSITNEIENNNLLKNSYQIIYQGKTINLTTFTLNNRKLSSKNWNIIVKRIVLMALLSKKDIINIDLYFTRQEKKVVNKQSFLGPNEINSGVTTWGNVNKIAIFREEEMNKLIIHELIHYCNLDFHDVVFSHINMYNINPSTKIILNESYTELMANIINCICCSYEYQNQENIRLFNLYLTYEIKYSIFQCAKILLLFGFKNYQEFNKPYDGNNKFQQQTSVFSYFFVKCALLYNINNFAKFLDNFVLQNKSTIVINNIIKAKTSYVELVHKSLQNSHFKNIINTMIHKISKNKNVSSKIKNTLRMTCIES